MKKNITRHNTQYKPVGVQWFVGRWFSHQLFPTVATNALRTPNRFILSNVWQQALKQL